MKHFFLLTAAVLLMGCASQIMSGFVGKPMTVVVGQYGLPATSFDVDTNKRAFVWQIDNTRVVPGSSYTTGSVVGNQVFASTYSSPARTRTRSCGYVLYAERTRTDIEGPAAWTIVGYEKPRRSCE